MFIDKHASCRTCSNAGHMAANVDAHGTHHEVAQGDRGCREANEAQPHEGGRDQVAVTDQVCTKGILRWTRSSLMTQREL